MTQDGKGLRIQLYKKNPAGRAKGRLVRVSAMDQKELCQLDGITVDKRFTDKASVKDMYRPQLQLLLEYVRDGDTMGRLAMGPAGSQPA